LSYEALWRKDRGPPHTAEANIAKLVVARSLLGRACAP
jgi:hypothetical protein